MGFFMVWKPQIFVDLVGEPEFAEKVFGSGHGTTAFQFIGIIIIFASFMIMTGLFQTILLAIFGPLMRF